MEGQSNMIVAMIIVTILCHNIRNRRTKSKPLLAILVLITKQDTRHNSTSRKQYKVNFFSTNGTKNSTRTYRDSSSQSYIAISNYSSSNIIIYSYRFFLFRFAVLLHSLASLSQIFTTTKVHVTCMIHDPMILTF